MIPAYDCTPRLDKNREGGGQSQVGIVGLDDSGGVGGVCCTHVVVELLVLQRYDAHLIDEAAGQAALLRVLVDDHGVLHVVALQKGARKHQRSTVNGQRQRSTSTSTSKCHIVGEFTPETSNNLAYHGSQAETETKTCG